MGLRVTEDEFQGFLLKMGKAEHVPREPSPQKKSKYNNKYVKVDGELFHSQGEYYRCCDLRLQEKAGLITGLQRQKPIPIIVNGMKICDLILDFVYCENEAEVWEDYKGVETEVFRLKKQLIAACYGKEIRITRKK